MATLLLAATLTATTAQESVWQGKGRIAISSDGNDHDHDDWGATAMSLALIGASGLQDKLCLYTYSDHIWSSNQTHPSNEIGKSAYEQMRESALRGAEYFGFDKKRFVCAVDNPERAYERLTEQINLSSEENPLIIVAGGPMQVVGEAINRADRSHLKYVSLISHSRWNNTHGGDTRHHNVLGWTFAQIEDLHTPSGLKCVQIIDQNGKNGREGLKCPKINYNWMLSRGAFRNSRFSQEAWKWLYGRMESFGEVKPSQRDMVDVSDAGMVLYLLTGNEEGTAADVRAVLEK